MIPKLRRSLSSVCEPSINFFSLFPIIFSFSSLVSTYSLKNLSYIFYYFVYFQLFVVVLAFLTYFGTFFLIKLLKLRGLVSNNLNNETDEKVPEPGALVGCVLYILSMIFVQLLLGDKCGKYFKVNPGLASIVLMTLLGLIDDVLLLNWFSKIAGPVLASLPLCLAYCGTKIGILEYLPKPINSGSYVKLLSCFYIAILTVFCANSINIYAGINGLELGQSLVMSLFILISNSLSSGVKYGEFGMNLEKKIYVLYLTMPFIAINIALICFNWYPAKLFVGNVYTLFSGTFFSVVLIMSNMCEMAPFIFLPQLINFLLSIPQLLGFIPCPRHRVPRFNGRTKKLENSKNLTLLNLFLLVFGPMEEEKLSLFLIAFQIFCGVLGLIVKYGIIKLV
ncbi:Glycosyl transferase family 4 protein [Theileria parva strain Muguga]|uniref:Glycosyl transferase family 4 protein n=1 Tax=Theileria parva strain Muguga TaxID=333668 RepID=UPI001C6224AB|nr:Glycosyl transferase family 4 protein [Theileria parva strain Muguga]EAN33362.2 Glycosyl transferase family 4 protein [Theileria parva strain Muguga]